VDPALLRPGRFDKLVEIPAPDLKSRLAILEVHTKKMPIEKLVNLKEIAQKTDGYSGADIEALCREAGMEALRENQDASKVNARHFETALKMVRPTLVQQIKQKEAKDALSGYS